jgi:hypothetical protein
MSENDAKRLPIDTPLALAKGIESIPPGGRAYVTFEDIQSLTGQTCEEYLADHATIMGAPQRIRLEPNSVERRLYYVRPKSN